MTISEPNPRVKPTGEEAGEFLEPPEPNPPTPPGVPADGTPEPQRTHADERNVAEDEPADWPPLADGSSDDRDEVMDA